MIEQQARVSRIDDAGAWITVGGQAGCSACDAGRGCGAGIFGRLLRRRNHEFHVPGATSLNIGQSVMLGMAESDFLGLVFRLYGFPLLAGLAGAAVCHQIMAYYAVPPGVADLAVLAAGLFVGWVALHHSLGRVNLLIPDLELRAPDGGCALPGCAATDGPAREVPAPGNREGPGNPVD